MTHDVYITDVAEVVPKLGGRQAVADRLPCGPNAVSNAVKRGRLPSEWWIVMTGLATERGLVLSPALFTFVQPCAMAAAPAVEPVGEARP